VALAALASLHPAAVARAQDSSAAGGRAVAPVTDLASITDVFGITGGDSLGSRPRATGGDARAPRRHWARFALGFATSLAVHEAAHVVASYVEGATPSFGFDKARPTIYSGIDESADPHRQFVFSSAGLTAQTLLDEALLDVPHRRGGSFESGILAGGLATVAFYVTIGRNAPVSDVTRMAATSSLSRTQISLIFGGVSALHAARIHHGGYFATPFATPTEGGRLKVGVWMEPR
jgi:hypothetical protein